MLNKTTLAAAADTIAQEWTGDDVSRAIYREKLNNNRRQNCSRKRGA